MPCTAWSTLHTATPSKPSHEPSCEAPAMKQNVAYGRRECQPFQSAVLVVTGKHQHVAIMHSMLQMYWVFSQFVPSAANTLLQSVSARTSQASAGQAHKCPLNNTLGSSHQGQVPHAWLVKEDGCSGAWLLVGFTTLSRLLLQQLLHTAVSCSCSCCSGHLPLL